MGFWKLKFISIGGELSVSGLRFFSDPKQHWVRRIFWLLLILAGTGLMLYQIWSAITFYRQYPTKTAVEQVFSSSVVFPAVTFCNINRYLNSRAVALGLAAGSATGLQTAIFSAYEEVLDTSSTTTINSNVLQALLGPWYFNNDWGSIFGNLTLQNLTHQFRQCKFNGKECQADWFSSIWTPKGHCVTFNKDQTMRTEQGGPNNGLQIMMYNEEPEELALNDITTGFYVYLHNKTQYPQMNKGFKMTGGAVSYAKISKVETTLLTAPHGKCSHGKPLQMFQYYTQENCQADCLLRHLIQTCSCEPIYVVNHTMRICSLHDEFACMKPAQSDYYTRNLAQQCDCPVDCFRDEYIANVGPMEIARLVMLHLRANKAKFNLNPTSHVNTKDLAALNLFYPSVSYVTHQTQPAYTSMQLLGEIGGAMGLLLGSTFFTIIEFFDILLWATCEYREQRQNMPHT